MRCLSARVGGTGVALPALALFQPIAVAVHFQDVDVVREPVEQRAGEPFGGEHAGPFVKRQVAGDDGRTALVGVLVPDVQKVTLRKSRLFKGLPDGPWDCPENGGIMPPWVAARSDWRVA